MAHSTIPFRKVLSVVCLIAAAIWIGVLILARPATTPDAPPRPDARMLDPLVNDYVERAVAEVNRSLDNAGPWTQLARVYHANDMLELADDCYTQALELDETAAETWHARAFVRSQLGRLDSAIDDMEQSIERDRAYVPAHWRLGQWRFDRGELDAATISFEAATRLDPGDAGGWIGLARVHLAAGRPEDAIDALDHVRTGPNAGYCSTLLAAAYRALGRADDAEVEAARAKGSEPALHDPRLTEITRFETGFRAEIDRATALAVSGRHQEAIRRLDRLRERWPDNHVVLNNLASSCMQSGRVDQAVIHLEHALDVAPAEHHTYLNLAQACLLQARGDRGFLDRALEYSKQALAIAPESGRARGMHAVIHIQRGDAAAAVDALNAALEVDPTNTGYLLDRAHQLRRLERYADALVSFGAVLELDPENLYGLLGRALVHMDAGDVSEAAKELGRVRDVVGADHTAYIEAKARLDALRPKTP